MKEYEFVEVRLRQGAVVIIPADDYRTIIKEYASKGYEYVGFIPSQLGGQGQIVYADLIFAKEVE